VHLALPDDFLVGSHEDEVGVTARRGSALAVRLGGAVGPDGYDPGLSARLVAVGLAGEDVLVAGRDQSEVELAMGGPAHDEGCRHAMLPILDFPARAIRDGRALVRAGASSMGGLPPF